MSNRRSFLRKVIFLWFLCLAFICNSCHAEPTDLTASWYSSESCQREGTSGILTASGERFDENALTCAMRSRDFGRFYKITNLVNGKSVIVKHTDFGPNKKLWKKGRIVDLSKAAFEKISDLKTGVINVKVEIL